MKWRLPGTDGRLCRIEAIVMLRWFSPDDPPPHNKRQSQQRQIDFMRFHLSPRWLQIPSQLHRNWINGGRSELSYPRSQKMTDNVNLSYAMLAVNGSVNTTVLFFHHPEIMLPTTR